MSTANDSKSERREPRNSEWMFDDLEWVFQIVLCLTVASGAVYGVLSLNNLPIA